MAYDSVRAQLDKLLGADRNGPLTGVNKSKLHYSDPSICKHFLLGFCPNDLHIKHRSEQGSCPNVHSNDAKTNFEKDRELGKVRGDLLRWTRDSLQVCRSILAEEERKIRAHARRLQDTYNSHESLSGLMIKNFDTLKKLGMVSQDAKVVVLSELDNDFKQSGPDLFPSDNDNAAKPGIRSYEGVNTTKSTHSNSNPRSQGSNSSSSSDDGANKNTAFDDDLEGFGVIKVVSATKDDTNDIIVSEPKQDPTDLKTSSDEDRGKSNEKSGRDTTPNNSTLSDAENTIAESNAMLTPTSVAAKAQSLPSDSPEIKNNAPKDVDDEAKKQDKPTASPQDKMEEFYATGKGPDGLLMLEKKQSLRVCACCGGFISLVDAESRLLSHYGGKSHQSLLQLRRRVEELEKVCADMRRQTPDRSLNDRSRGFSNSRDSRWVRRDNGRTRSPAQRDEYYQSHNSRHMDRYERRRDGTAIHDHRGYGTSEWRHRPSRDRDDYGRNDSYGRRSGEERRYSRGGSSDYYRREDGYRNYRRDESSDYYRRGSRDYGYESGRKRHRSRSPDFSRQRFRRY